MYSIIVLMFRPFFQTYDYLMNAGIDDRLKNFKDLRGYGIRHLEEMSHFLFGYGNNIFTD